MSPVVLVAFAPEFVVSSLVWKVLEDDGSDRGQRPSMRHCHSASSVANATISDLHMNDPDSSALCPRFQMRRHLCRPQQQHAQPIAVPCLVMAGD